MKYLLILLLLVSCKDTTTTIVKITDGDTYILSDGTRVRLKDVDSPELGQRFGYEAKLYAQSMLLNREVFIEKKGKDKYGRTLVNIRFKEHASTFNLCMVLNGYAHVYKFSKNKELLEGMEYAKKNKSGLFAYPYELPYNFRKHHKNEQ